MLQQHKTTRSTAHCPSCGCFSIGTTAAWSGPAHCWDLLWLQAG